MLMDSELQEIVMIMMSPLRTRSINYDPASIEDFGNSYEAYRSNIDWFASTLVENQLIQYSDFMAFLNHYREFFGDYYPLIADMDNRDVDEVLLKYVDLNAKIELKQLKR